MMSLETGAETGGKRPKMGFMVGVEWAWWVCSGCDELGAGVVGVGRAWWVWSGRGGCAPRGEAVAGSWSRTQCSQSNSFLINSGQQVSESLITLLIPHTCLTHLLPTLSHT